LLKMMNARVAAIAASFLICTAANAAEVAADALVGTWLTEQADSKVQIAGDGKGYTGKVVWLKQPQRDGKPVADANNADPAQRSRPVMGLEVLSGIQYTANNTWTGSIYSPRKGRSYPAQLSLDGSHLAVKVKDGIFSKTVSWTRAP
jgi:uncharacterized protein (DUF2147 family)